MRVAIAGDVLHSRVARSNVWLLRTLGAEVTLVAPPTLLPIGVEQWPCSVSYDLDETLEKGVDAVMMLRVQGERMNASFFPSTREYSRRWGFDDNRLRALDSLGLKDTIIMHPGPMNRGLEISAAAADSPRSTVLAQVRNGVSVRMAALYLLLSGDTREPAATLAQPMPATPPVPPRRATDGRQQRNLPHPRRRHPGRRRRGPADPRRRHRRARHRPVRDRHADGATVIDAAGLVALPGMVDVHTHLREPGREDAETVETGTRAAALGGFTAVHAMANSTPVADTAGVVEQVYSLGRAAGWVDVRPVGAVTVGLAGRAAGRTRRHGGLPRPGPHVLRRRHLRP